MRRFFAILLALTLLLLCACSEEKEESYEAYHYGKMPDEYTVEEALEDHCLVLQWQEGSIRPEVYGMENWDYFLEGVDQDADLIKLRVVYFMNGFFYYSDFSYGNGTFSLYTLNEYQHYENEISGYSYLRRIKGTEPNTGNDVCYYVLTNDKHLKSEEVLSLNTICDIEAEKDVPFEPVPFTQWLYLD